MEVLVFVSSHCPACPSAEKLVKEVVPDYYEQGADYQKIRAKTKEGKELAMEYGIRGTPTIILIKDGVEIERFVGTPAEGKLRGSIEKALGLKKSFFNNLFKR